MALLFLKLIKHWVKLAEPATETKKKARRVRCAIPVVRAMGWALDGGSERRGGVILPVAFVPAHPQVWRCVRSLY